MEKLSRMESGIPGFDKLVNGGFPEKDLILLSGASGSGKTIFGLQFLFANAMKEAGIYVSFEEPLIQIKSTASSFGWDTEKMEKFGRMQMLRYDPFKLEDIIEIIENNIREIGAKRIVIDSISALGIYVKDVAELRRMILQVSNMLRRNDCTSLIISEVVKPGQLSRFGVEEFVTDGVVLMHNFFVGGEYRRGISVWKMRSTDHSRKVHPYRITDKGFVVYPSDMISLR